MMVARDGRGKGVTMVLIDWGPAVLSADDVRRPPFPLVIRTPPLPPLLDCNDLIGKGGVVVAGDDIKLLFPLESTTRPLPLLLNCDDLIGKGGVVLGSTLEGPTPVPSVGFSKVADDESAYLAAES